MTISKSQCKTCVLHSCVPGVKIEDNGNCSICAKYEKFKEHEPAARKYLTEEMESLFEKVRKENRPYDAIVLFSGGKDSTILLKMAIRKYKLRPLALALMHPLVNDIANKNMEDVTKKLNVELMKFYPEEAVYKKAVRNGIVNGPKYELGEFFGCDICSFFHHWIPVRLAIKLGIPIILEGSDLSQTGEITYLQGQRVIDDAKKGIKPYRGVHDCVMDALGEEYKGSIYDYDEKEVIESNYPTIISPFSFLEYDYRENFREIEGMGLKKKDYRTIYTNCTATPFFSFFAINRFDCVSYIKHYATEVRRGYPNLMQHSVKTADSADVLNREVVGKMIKEYQDVVMYIGKHKLREETVSEEELAKLRTMAPTYIDVFGDSVCDVFLHDVLQIPVWAEYFDVDLDMFLKTGE